METSVICGIIGGAVGLALLLYAAMGALNGCDDGMDGLEDEEEGCGKWEGGPE